MATGWEPPLGLCLALSSSLSQTVSADCPPEGRATGGVAFRASLALVVLQRLNQALVVFFHLQEDGLGHRFVVALLGLGGDD